MACYQRGGFSSLEVIGILDPATGVFFSDVVLVKSYGGYVGVIGVRMGGLSWL